MKATPRRRIPISSIICIPGTSPRVTIDRTQVAHFKSLYNDPATAERIPPIEVQLIQSGDPKKKMYALIEGLHRLTARQEDKYEDIDALISCKRCLTLEEVETKEEKGILLKRACQANARNGNRLTDQDRVYALKALAELGSPVAEIAKWAAESGFSSRRFVYKTLQYVIKADKERQTDEGEEKKERCFKLLNTPRGPKSVRHLAHVLGETEWTIRTWMREHAEETSQPEVCEQFPVHSPHTLPQAPAKKTVSLGKGLIVKKLPPSDRKACQTVAKAFDMINRIDRPSKSLEADVRHRLFPLLMSRYPSIAETIENRGFSQELTRLHQEHEQLQQSYKELAQRAAALDAESTDVKAQLKERTRYCRFTCLHSLERLKIENRKTLDHLLKAIVDHVKRLPLFEGPAALPALELTLLSILPFLSSVEYAIHQGFMDNTLVKTFAAFRRAVPDDISKRLNGIVLPGTTYPVRDLKRKINLLQASFEDFGRRSDKPEPLLPSERNMSKTVH